jgi:hypothetical protein
MDTPHPTQKVDIDEAEMFLKSLKQPMRRLEIVEDKSKGIVLVGENGIRRLELFPNVSNFLLGRFSEVPLNSNWIDLSAFGPDSSSVSRIHAQIHMEDDDLYITDLSSRNGTFVDGRSLEPHRPKLLLPETSITLGHLQLKVHLQVQEWGQTS